MMTDLLVRLGEFLRRVKIEEDKGAFGDLLEIARVENALAEADGRAIPVRTGVQNEDFLIGLLGGPDGFVIMNIPA